MIVIATLGIFTLFTNALAERQFHRPPPQLANDQVFSRNVMEEIRQQDLIEIRNTSIWIFANLVIVSIVCGYIIAGRLLEPLHTALRLQQQFIANASHELKTPLAISQINLEASLHDVNLTTEQREQLQRTLNANRFMNRLIEDLLLLAQTDTTLPMQRVDLKSVVNQASDLLTPLAQTQAKTLALHLPSEPMIISGNATLLQRAIMNCIENGIKYGKQVITITLSKQRLMIQDDGDGIAPEHLPKVTERFYRVDTSRSRQTGGSGLGLAITKTIIAKHHGRLAIQSTVGEGTTVTLQF